MVIRLPIFSFIARVVMAFIGTIDLFSINSFSCLCHARSNASFNLVVNTRSERLLFSPKNLISSSLSQLAFKSISEAVAYRISDILEYADFREDFINKIGKYNVSILKDISDLYIDFPKLFSTELVLIYEFSCNSIFCSCISR